MDGSAIGAFLRARRELVRPEDVGIPATGVRRVVGLRREEVASLAGISQEYYLRLEQGRDHQPSDQVLASLARALRLDDDTAAYLRRLARPDSSSGGPHERDTVDPALLLLIGQWTSTPAMILNSCQDVLAINAMAAEYLPPSLRPGHNLVLDIFSPFAKEQAPDWEMIASRAVAALRMMSRPDDPRLLEIVGDLSARDADFRRLWARHDAKPLDSGPSITAIEGFGIVELRWQNLIVPNAHGQVITVFYGEPGTLAESSLRSVADRLSGEGS